MHSFRKIDSLNNQIFEQTLSKVEDQFILKVIRNDIGHRLLHQFEELKKYNSLFVHKNIEFKNDKGSFLILLIEKHLTIGEVKGTSRNARIQDTEREEVEPILIFTIAEDIGKVQVRNETWGDKIEDLFNKQDINFPSYPKFSKNYFVSGDNPDLIRQKFPIDVLKTLDRIPDLTLEITGKFVLLRTGRNLTEEVLLLLISIGNKIINNREH